MYIHMDCIQVCVCMYVCVCVVQAIVKANNMEIKCPHQCFINNEFVDSTGGKTFSTINPNDESVICQVASSQKEDVLKAVQAAKVCRLHVQLAVQYVA